jgi:hypothetical protein
MTADVHLPFVVGLWIIFAIVLVRGIRRPSLLQGPAWYGWIQLICAGLVFSLQGEAVEEGLDQFFGGFPVTLSIKFFGMLLWFGLYYLIIKRVFPNRGIYTFIDWILISAVGIGIASVLWLVSISPEDRMIPRNIVTALRDVLLVMPAILLFVPATIRIAQRERIPGLKVKQYAIALCFGAYAVVGLLNIQKGVWFAIYGEPTGISSIVPTLALLVCLFGFVVLLIPYRWLTRLYYPTRLRLYARLRRLERNIMVQIGAPEELPHWSFRFLNGQELELQIYRTTINILDYGLLLPETQGGEQLGEQLRQLATQHNSYAMLVNQLRMLSLCQK